MPAQWTRTHDALGVQEALGAVDSGTSWAILWCGGGTSRSGDSPQDQHGVAYVRRHLIDPAERERLFKKAQRTGRTRTVVMAERWESVDHSAMILFYEGGPYLLPDGDDPIRR